MCSWYKNASEFGCMFTVDGEGRLQEPSKRQRRWNTEKNDIDVKAPPKVLQTESVKEETSSEVKETAAPSLVTLPLAVPASSTPKSASGLDRVAISRPALSRSDVPVNGETQKTRVVPPSTKPPTTSLKIDKFLRPFTHKAVKELLANTGAVQAMWMDQIKTHCYVMYSTVEEAVATRNALYNLQWPPQGGRLLTAEFVEPEEVKIRCDGEKAATSNAPTTRGPVPANNTPAEHVVSAPPPTHPSSLPPVPASGLPPPPPLPPPPRERPPMPSKQEMESQGPTLDDLFKKTRAKPHIYYLPLTDQDVAAKLAARRPLVV
jgi:apoptotic chromatin condensation inducer in the nucleus